MQVAIRPRPANYTILHKILQNLRQSFFRTHCVTLTENMRLVIQCKLNTVLLPRPPIEFVKHCIICEPAGSNGSRACVRVGAVDTTAGERTSERVAVVASRSRRVTRPPPPAPLINNLIPFTKFSENTCCRPDFFLLIVYYTLKCLYYVLL